MDTQFKHDKLGTTLKLYFWYMSFDLFLSLFYLYFYFHMYLLFYA